MSLCFILTISTLILLTIIVAAESQASLYSFSEIVDKNGPSLNKSRENAPRIFNAIHSSTRQWGSSFYHNGMSFFPAKIPKNTYLYHGTNKAYTVTGMQWLAFEVEHAELFSQASVGRPPPEPPEDSIENQRHTPPGSMELVADENADEVLRVDDDGGQVARKGYLHVYRTTRPLTNLLYIDGMSAGKTSMGTVDTQDLVLLHNSDDNDGLAVGDLIRGRKLCALGAEWGVEGFVRMEMGFEVIFCDFGNGLELESARQRPHGENLNQEKLKQFEVLRGASSRYGGITSQRLSIDYSGMVSAFWYDLNLTNPDIERADLPRLLSSESEGLLRMQDDVRLAVNDSRERGGVGNDWQGVVDMIITRYSDRLQLMANNETSGETILTHLAVLLNIYIDYRHADISTAKNKCSTHYLTAVVPQTTADYMIYEAVLHVMTKICSTLFYIRELLLNDNEIAYTSALEESKLTLKLLIEYLGWTTWVECGKCDYDEVCFIAIWPWGSPEDHEHPSCMKEELLSTRHGYWKGNPMEY